MSPDPETPATDRRWQTARADLASPDIGLRASALHALARLALADPGLRTPTLDACADSVAVEPDPWVAGTAARVIETLTDADTARPFWQSLLTRLDPHFAGRAAFVMADVSHAPMLRSLLDARPEPAFRSGALRTLGRLQDASALPLLLDALADPVTREDAILALGWLGRPEAVPALEALRQDSTPAITPGERGDSLTIGDLTYDAVLALRHPRPYTPDPFPPPEYVPPPPRPARPSLRSSNRTTPPPLQPHAPLAHRLLPFAPLACAIADGPWFVALLLGYLYVYGTAPPTPLQHAAAATLCLFPPLFGLLLAAMALRDRLVRTPPAWAAFTVGTALCGLLTFMFGGELFG